MSRKTLAVHFHELALKGRNRKRFEATLRDNLRKVMRPLGEVEVKSVESRVLVDLDASIDTDEALARARQVFGVAHCFRVERVKSRDLDEVARLVLAAVKERAPASFRITTRRNDKKFPMKSVEVDRQVGAVVHEATGVPVKLAAPALNAYVLIMADEILVGTHKLAGPGGLPMGTGGRVATLLSGGIDSPVAAWRMMKRGCHVDFIHFHSHPLVDKKSIEKAEELTERLTRWQYTSRLHLAPLAEMQTAARLHAPEQLRVILYRRFMVRIAQVIARRNRCRALVTGEALGQVASQTLVNLGTVDSVANLPVLRPLIGFDKQEIVDEALAIDTYEVSIEPDQDCCKLFLPKHPAVAARVDECEEAEKALDVEALVTDAVKRTETLTFRWPA
jgi:thiamine biosynthesis protein ThiI